MTNLDSILKSRDITLTTKVRLVKAIIFPGRPTERDNRWDNPRRGCTAVDFLKDTSDMVVRGLICLSKEF